MFSFGTFIKTSMVMKDIFDFQGFVIWSNLLVELLCLTYLYIPLLINSICKAL